MTKKGRVDPPILYIFTYNISLSVCLSVCFKVGISAIIKGRDTPFKIKATTSTSLIAAA